MGEEDYKRLRKKPKISVNMHINYVEYDLEGFVKKKRKSFFVKLRYEAELSVIEF